MIKRQGEPRTEQIVSDWVANEPVLINGDTNIVQAIAAGQCDVGLVNHYYLALVLAKDADTRWVSSGRTSPRLARTSMCQAPASPRTRRTVRARSSSWSSCPRRK